MKRTLAILAMVTMAATARAQIPEQLDLQYLNLAVDASITNDYANVERKLMRWSYEMYQYAVTNAENDARAIAKWNTNDFCRISNTNKNLWVWSEPVIEFSPITKAEYLNMTWLTNALSILESSPKAAAVRCRKSERAAWLTSIGARRKPQPETP